jgi:redox-sensitive bicupin YhaK (pirin superfamily)
VQCARGNITVNELALKEGDGAAVSEERAVTISGAGPAGGELLFIDLA